MIATFGRAEIARQKSKFAVVVDKERSETANLFSPRNTISYTQQIMKMDVPDEISCSFTDETTGWQLNARSAFNTADGLPDGNAKTKQTSSLWGVTDPDTVFKFVRYMYACIKNRPLLHLIKLDLGCLTCKKGDLIEYAGDAALTGTAYARVKRLILDEGGALGLISDTVFPMEEGESYGIRCRRQNGVLVTLRVKNEGKSERFLYFQDAQSEYVLAEGDLVAFGVMGKITRQLLVREIAAKDGLRATLPRVSLPVRAAVLLSVSAPRRLYRAGVCLHFFSCLLFYLFPFIQSTLPRTVPLFCVRVMTSSICLAVMPSEFAVSEAAQTR
jgi:hypothetical protein